MLQYQTIYPETLECLKQLTNLDILKDFYLVGGTSLALQIGHRISIDLDFFTRKNFSSSALFEQLKKELPIYRFTIIGKAENTLNLLINDIKVDIIRFDYPLIDKIIVTDNFKLMGMKDIAAAKLSAVTNRGTKKDFFDIYFLLQHFSLEDILNFFQEKYQMDIAFFHIKSLTYFDDAELEPDPNMLINASWEDVKLLIRQKVQELL